MRDFTTQMRELGVKDSKTTVTNATPSLRPDIDDKREKRATTRRRSNLNDDASKKQRRHVKKTTTTRRKSNDDTSKKQRRHVEKATMTVQRQGLFGSSERRILRRRTQWGQVTPSGSRAVRIRIWTEIRALSYLTRSPPSSPLPGGSWTSASWPPLLRALIPFRLSCLDSFSAVRGQSSLGWCAPLSTCRAVRVCSTSGACLNLVSVRSLPGCKNSNSVADKLAYSFSRTSVGITAMRGCRP